MSYGVYVYSKSPKILDRKDLREKMNSHGRDVLFQKGYSDAKVAVEGPMEDEIIVGWRPGQNSLEDVRRLIESNDASGLDDLYANQTLVGCEIWVECPYELPESELEDMAEYKSPEELEIVRTAKSHYSISTSAGRTPASFEFQEYVARSIAELTDGWVEDPQSGESGTADEISTPMPWQKSISPPQEERRPWLAITVYAISAVVSLLALILGWHPDNPLSLVFLIPLVLCPLVALGLYRANQSARILALGISIFQVIMGLVAVIYRGLSSEALVYITVSVLVIRELLSEEVKAYFAY